MGERLFTSDHHFGHENIISFCDRPFADVDEMNMRMIDAWNDSVSDDDEVWIVGDLAMGQINKTVPLAAALRGHKILVPGNHDRVHPMHKVPDPYRLPKWATFVDLYESAGMTIVDPLQTIEIGGETVKVCHFPYFGDSRPGNDRFSGNRPDDEGGWLICGHVHDAWTVKNKMVNVGVDVWDFRPVPEDWIAEIMRENPDGISL